MFLSYCWCLQIEAINEAFVEARDEIEYAKEVYTVVLLLSSVGLGIVHAFTWQSVCAGQRDCVLQ